MLVLISDLHLTDGTCGETVPAEAFYIFRDQLRMLAYNASWRQDGTYRPVEELNLILLGDVLDLIHSTLWLEEADGTPVSVRPWHDPHAQDFSRKVQQITHAILQHNLEGISVFRQMAQNGTLRLPPADRFGRPTRDRTATQVPIRVNLYYMVGNHDWPFHLPGTAYDAIRHSVIQALGLANAPTIFPHDPFEDTTLADLMARHRLLARHGDIFDPFNYHRPAGRDAASLGDVFAVELTNRFPLEIRRQMGETLPRAFYDSMRRLVNVRPPLAAPVWIMEQARKHTRNRALEEQVKAIWNQMGERFLALEVLRRFDSPWPLDVLSALRSVIVLSRLMPFATVTNMLVWMQKHLNGNELSLAQQALKEAGQGVHYVVYGHTHHHEVVPLGFHRQNGREVEQLYANTGTWHAYYNLSRYNLQERNFVPYTEMTFLALYEGDERRGQRMEAWHGVLS